MVDDKFDEFSIIKSRYNDAVNERNYFLIILPTVNCNYKCWYCYQQHLPSHMSTETMEKIKKHISYVIKNFQITSLHIEWFGGEPFMYYNDVIKPLSQFAQILCRENNIQFRNTATTNGYYINSTIQKSMKSIKISQLQLTLDGLQDVHDQVKYAGENRSAFSISLSNMEQYLTLNETFRLYLRLNYTRENLSKEIVSQVNNFISVKNRSRVDVFFRKVWQESVDRGRVSLITEISQLFRDSGYQTPVMNDLNLDFKTCYADKKFFNTINWNGDVLKCTADEKTLYTNNPPGKLKADGQIEWQQGFLEDYYKIRFECDNCMECKHLPICMGRCPKSSEYLDGKRYCKMSLGDFSIEDSILQYISEVERYNI
ncbi:radical SAM/SPASM domain-containing protein [Porphyromonas crevioricanis]